MKTYHEIKSIVQSRSCPVHNLRPVVYLHPEFTDVTCCCNFFKSICFAEIRGLIKAPDNAKVQVAWKQGFGNNLWG